MAIFLMTLHAFGTWEPDRLEGYWHHTAGRLHQDREEAKRRRGAQIQDAVLFTPDVQQVIIAGAIEAASHLRLTLRAIATSFSHVHPLLMWRDARPETSIRRELKQSLTIRLNRQFQRRAWFVRKGWCQRVSDDGHLEHLVLRYLPSHPGWFWSSHSGLRAPIAVSPDRVS